MGAAIATDDERAALFLMADAFVLLSGDLDGIGGSVVRAGVGPYAGLRLRLPGPVVAVVGGSWSYLPAQELVGTYDVRGLLRAEIAPDVALGIETAIQPASMEAQLGSYLYF